MAEPARVHDPDTRHCPGCNIARPANEFYADDRLYTHCASCRANYKAESDARRQKLIQEFRKKLTSERIDVPHISQFAEALLKEFGGVHEFCRLYREQADIAFDKRGGSLTSFRYLQAVMEAVRRSTEHRQSAPDVSLLSDDELEGEIKSLYMELLDDERMDDVMRDWARRRGYTVSDDDQGGSQASET